MTSIAIPSDRSRLVPEQRATYCDPEQRSNACKHDLRSHSAVSPRRPADCCKRSNEQQEKEASHGLLTNVNSRTHSVNYAIAKSGYRLFRDQRRY